MSKWPSKSARQKRDRLLRTYPETGELTDVRGLLVT